MTYEGSATTRLKTIEIDTTYGNNVGDSFSIVVVDDDLTPESVVLANQSGTPATGKDVDEAELDHFIVSALPSSDGGSMTLILRPLAGVTLSGKYKITYVIG